MSLLLLLSLLFLPAKNCAELYKSGQRISGVYTTDPDGSGAFNIYCDHMTAGGGWTVIQKRMDGSVDLTAPRMTTNMASVTLAVNFGSDWTK